MGGSHHRAPPPGGVASFGIDMNPQRTRLTIGACMRYDDNTAHIELAEYRDTNHDGTMWAVNLIDKVWEQTAALVIDGQSPATALLPDLAQAGVTVTVTAATDMGRACSASRTCSETAPSPTCPKTANNHSGKPPPKPPHAPSAKTASSDGTDPTTTPTSAHSTPSLALHGAMTTRRDPTQETETWF